MPIFDIALDREALSQELERFDVDSVYAENAPDELEEFLLNSRYGWRGRAEFGPFGDEGGLLRSDALIAPSRTGLSPWQCPTAPMIAVAAYLRQALSSDKQSSDRPINDTTSLLELATSFVRPTPRGFIVLRDQNGQDVAQFWNCRSLTSNTYPLTQDSAEFNTAVLADVPDATVFLERLPTRVERAVPFELPVWGYDDLCAVEQERLDKWAKKQQSELIPLPREEALTGTWFPGFERILSNSFRINADATTRLIPLDIPELPLRDNVGLFPGMVAAEVDFHEASGVDPRLTVSIPPCRRHAKLIDRPGDGADQTRISSVGPVLGIQVNLDEIAVLNASQMDVMRLLFDDNKVVVGQSDEGKFQTRAAELFGGPLTANLNQPGSGPRSKREAPVLAESRWDILKIRSLLSEVNGPTHGAHLMRLRCSMLDTKFDCS